MTTSWVIPAMLTTCKGFFCNRLLCSFHLKTALMAGKTINMSIVKQILRLRSNGVPLQTIAKAVKISRNTVKKYLCLIEGKKLRMEQLLVMEDEQLDALLHDPDPQDQQRFATLEALFPFFAKELDRTGVNRWVLWGEYRQKHPDGYSYSQFCDHFKQWNTSQSATMHMEHEPADKLFIDFTGKKLSVIDALTGEVSETEVFIATLGFSQLTYVQAVTSQRKEDFIAATENALHFFKGVPKAIVPDNLKSAVTRPDRYEAEINAAFLDFANHYGTTILPARSKKPRDKALVEKSVDIIYSRVFAPLRNQVFHSIAALNRAIAPLLDAHNNQHFQLRQQSRQQLFEEQEKSSLQPLPPERYEIKIVKEVTVMKNGYVQLYEDKHYYSVPYRFIGRQVKLIYSSRQLSVFYNRERIAYHVRGIRKYGYTTIKEHLSSTHQFVSEWNPDKFINWAAAIAAEVKEYITYILDHATHPEQAYRSCVGILSYEKKVGTERLIAAVKRAIYFGAYNYTIIKKILQNNLDQIPLGDENSQQASLPFHDNIRGAQSYQ
jgi:transposase